MLSRVESFENAFFHLRLWTVEAELFENADVTITQFLSNMENKVLPLMVSLLSNLMACLRVALNAAGKSSQEKV